MLYGGVWGANEENAILGLCAQITSREKQALQQYVVLFEVEVGMNEEGHKNVITINQDGRIRMHGLILQLWVGQVVSNFPNFDKLFQKMLLKCKILKCIRCK